MSHPDPQAMRAMAHPVRLAVLMHLQRHGPATATALSPHVGATPSVTSWHLRHLATFGLVTDAPADEVPGDRRQRWWMAVVEDVDQLISGAPSRLTPEWLRLAGPSDITLRLTLDELSTLAGRIDELLAPFVRRGDDAPADARRVRILRHFLPSDPPADA